MARGLEANWKAALQLVGRADLPLADLLAAPNVPLRIKWQNTPRQGCFAIGMDMEYSALMTLLQRLEHDREDFAIVLGLPGQKLATALLENAKGSPMGRNLVLWVPATPAPELRDAVVDWQARRHLEQELVREGDDHVHTLKAGTAELEKKLAGELAELYLAGKVASAQGEKDLPRTDLGWEARLTLLVGPCLEASFPRHAQVAPCSDCLTQHHLRQLWSGFLEPGSCGELMPTLLKELLLPLGLAVATGPGFRLEADAARTPVLAEIADRLIPGQRCPLRDLAKALGKGPYGTSPAVFAVLVACLVQYGKATVYANDRATSQAKRYRFGIDSLDSLLSFRLDALGPAQQLDAGVGRKLAAISWLWPSEEVLPFTPARQTELWRKAQPELEQLHRQSVSCKEWLSSAAAISSGEKLPLDQIRHHALAVEEMCLEVGSPKGATSGLRKLAGSKAAELSEPVAWVRGWSGFGRQQLRDFQQTMRRLQDLDESPLNLDLDIAQPEPVWKAFQSDYLEQEKARAQAYEAFHKEYYQHPAFGERSRLEALPQWKALQALSTVVGLEFQPRPAHLRNWLDELPRPCRRNVNEQLVLAGRCQCGLTVGASAPPSLPLLQEMIENALRSGLTSLIDQEEKLTAYLRELRQVGQLSRAEKLEELVAAASEGVAQRTGEGFWRSLSSRLLTCLDSATATLAGRALTGQAMVVRRDPEDLLIQLKGVTLPPDRLRRAFETWLAGDGLPSDAWIPKR